MYNVEIEYKDGSGEYIQNVSYNLVQKIIDSNNLKPRFAFIVGENKSVLTNLDDVKQITIAKIVRLESEAK